LFTLNSPFMRDQSTALAATVAKESDVDAKVRGLYRRLLARDPNEREVALGRSYLATGSLPDYAQALLSTNEVIFWP
jgi:hypothetical protein